MTDKATFARRLMRINERVVASNTPSAIFGSIGDLPQAVSSRKPYRIGFYPILSDEAPQLAMASASILSHLLERWLDVEVYRLFVKFDVPPEDFVWTIDKSQFTVEDWPIDTLDENIGAWGTLEKQGDDWALSITIDDDNLTGDDAEPAVVTLVSDSEGQLLTRLPELAADIVHTIGAGRLDDTDPAYPDEDISTDAKLHAFLEQILLWDVNLVATLWDVDWDDDDVEDDFTTLLDTAQAVGSDFAAWTIAKAIALTMRPGYSVIGDLLIDRSKDIADAFSSDYPMPILAGAVFNMGFAPKSYRLLNEEISERPQNKIAWLKSGEIHAEGGLLLDAIDKFQTAIENEAVNNHLFRAYGNVLLTTERSGDEVSSFILIDLSEYAQDYVLWEAVEAYSEALKLNPEDIRARYAKVLQLTEVDFEQQMLWDDFAELVKMDMDGEYTADVIDSLYNVEDITPGVTVLQSILEQYPDRLDIYLNLAALHIAGYDADSALPYLEKAKTMTTSAGELADIERMVLTANNPEFEYRFAEIKGILDAGNTLQADDVEFLEDVVENAPHAIEGHIALGRSYYAWKEFDEALEVLLDAQETFPDQPTVLDWLAKILWESGEHTTAFTYLNRGIAAHPFNVQLIARAGQYLFDNGQLDEARQFLARAEAIAPRHPMLRAVRAYIARRMAAEPEKYNNDQ